MDPRLSGSANTNSWINSVRKVENSSILECDGGLVSEGRRGVRYDTHANRQPVIIETETLRNQYDTTKHRNILTDTRPITASECHTTTRRDQYPASYMRYRNTHRPPTPTPMNDCRSLISSLSHLSGLKICESSPKRSLYLYAHRSSSTYTP